MEKGKNVAVYCGSRYGINPAHTAFAGMAGELLAKNGYTMIYGCLLYTSDAADE